MQEGEMYADPAEQLELRRWSLEFWKSKEARDLNGENNGEKGKGEGREVRGEGARRGEGKEVE